MSQSRAVNQADSTKRSTKCTRDTCNEAEKKLLTPPATTLSHMYNYYYCIILLLSLSPPPPPLTHTHTVECSYTYLSCLLRTLRSYHTRPTSVWSYMINVSLPSYDRLSCFVLNIRTILGLTKFPFGNQSKFCFNLARLITSFPC